jgi:phage virion morphogenesis protein
MDRAALTINGYDEALASLGHIVQRMDNAQPLYDQIGAALVVSTQNRFETESDPDGNPWPQSLRVRLEGGKTLTDSARLKNSITHEASNTGVDIGTNLIYAAVHQFGAVIKAKTESGLRFRAAGNGDYVNVSQVTIPQRAFLGIDEDDQAEIFAITADYIGDSFGGSDAD